MNSNQYHYICKQLSELVSVLGVRASTCTTGTCKGYLAIYGKFYELVNNAGLNGVSGINEKSSVDMINILGIFVAAVYNHQHGLMAEQHNKLQAFLPALDH